MSHLYHRLTSQMEEVQSFEKHPDEQFSSRLLRLPVEIRLKILRSLMRKPIPICSRLQSGYAENYLDGLALSSQLLRSCQRIYHEGLNILYNENTLSILCQPAGMGSISCGVLHLIVRAYHVLQYMGSSIHDTDLLSVAKRKLEQEHPIARTKDALELLPIYNSLLRFKRVQVHFECGQAEHDAICVLLVRLILKGKQVIISDPPNSFNYESLKALRCSSIVIQKKTQPEGIEKIVSLVTSSEPVEDIIEPWLNLLEVTHRLPGRARDLFDWMFVDEMNELLRAVVKFDVQLVKELTNGIIKLALEWNAECAKSESGRSPKQHEDMERRLLAFCADNQNELTRYLT